jgi:hypothetical protein
VSEAGCQAIFSPEAKRSRSLVNQTEISDWGGSVLELKALALPNADVPLLSAPTAKADCLMNSRREPDLLILRCTRPATNPNQNT